MNQTACSRGPFSFPVIPEISQRPDSVSGRCKTLVYFQNSSCPSRFLPLNRAAMKLPLPTALLSLLLFAALPLPAQRSEHASPSAVPHLIKYSGTLPAAPGRASVFDVKFSLYAEQSGGEPVWTETQQVTLDASGRYSVLLGATTPLPDTAFATGQARWLGVTLSDEQESARTILVATPYALNAVNAETLAGHPLSDFTLNDAVSKTSAATNITQINVGSGITGGGTGSTVTLGLSNSYLQSLGNSVYAQLAAANTFTKAQTFLSPVVFAAGQGFPGTATLLSNVFFGNQSVAGTDTINGSYYSSSAGLLTSYNSSSQGSAVWGEMTNYKAIGDGVIGKSDSAAGTGLHAIGIAASQEGTFLRGNGNASGTALWADTNASIATVSYGAFVATADNNYAATFANNSTEPTIYVNNSGTGLTGAAVPVLATTGAGGACMFSSVGDVTCSGRIKSAVPVAGRDTQVEVYSVQSSENWLEDFGTATLEDGRVTVTIDPQFSRIANTGAPYHVFLTPRGDSSGLYIASVSPQRFEVREAHTGHSSIAFDYRIVAKRTGYETERLTDTTVAMHDLAAHRDKINARSPAHPETGH
jgi:hypothetical protein